MKVSETMEILKGDCLSLLSKVADSSVKAIITDPPYFLGMTHNGQKGCFGDLAICEPFYEKLFKEFRRVLMEDGCVYFFCDWRGYAFYYPLFDRELGAKNLLVWDKGSGPGNYYTLEHELVLFSTLNSQWRCKGARNIIRGIASFRCGAKKTNGEKVHPTQKPVELIEKFVLDSTKENETVLDTFMGSGTTGLACANLGRRFIGMEIDKGYFNIAKTRIEGALKRPPLLRSQSKEAHLT